MKKLLFSVLVLSGCGSINQKKDEDTSSSSKISVENLNGTWQNACESGKDYSIQTTLTYQGDTLDRESVYFLNSTCQADQEFLRYSYKSDNIAVKDSVDLAGYTTYRMRYTYLAVGFSKDHRLLKEFSEKKRWGYSDWKIAEVKDLSGRVFDSECKDCSAKMMYDVRTQSVRIDEKGRLNFAIYKDGKTALVSDDLEDQYSKI